MRVRRQFSMRSTLIAVRLKIIFLAALMALCGASVPRAAAQGADAIQPGEAVVTRFSGTSQAGTSAIIDVNGTSASILDVRSPGQAPQGVHWWNEPQRAPVSASQIGQVFGIAIDKAGNIYLSATSAFGLHRTNDNSAWMNGMWGGGGGPGTIYRLDASNSYQPSRFADVMLDGRANTGAGLGNIAYDRWHNQLFVSDLETGMIHRLSIADGSDLGAYDHGTQGRVQFLDAATGMAQSLPAAAFDPATAARIDDCAAGPFTATPACWNVADFRRRIWGLAVRRDEASGDVRLYYAVWGSQAFGNPDWAMAGDDQKNSIWSIAIGADGGFDIATVRREFTLPDFFTRAEDIALHGASQPVSDIAFPELTPQTVMLVAERGGLRNLGLNSENAFADPHSSRTLRYELQSDGTWQLAGRYDIGFYDRRNEGQPFLRANSAGGASFGYGYSESFAVDTGKADQWVWLTGDSLCSPDGPCFDPSAGEYTDTTQVHGAQGTEQANVNELMPPAALQPHPATGYATEPTTPARSAMLDFDINVDANGSGIDTELFRNDATRVGDIEVFQVTGVTEPEIAGVEPPVEPEPSVVPEPQPGPGPEPGPPEDHGGFDMAIDKAGPAECERGQFCDFTITVRNNGPDAYTGPVYLVEDLLAEITDYDVVDAAADGWHCDRSEGSLICMHEEVTLAAGESIDMALRLRVPVDWAENELRNCALIAWPQADEAAPADVDRWVEAALKLMEIPDYDPGVVDGVIDAAAEDAIRNYQTDMGLAVTGTVTPELIDALFPDGAVLTGDLNPANDEDCETTPITGRPALDLAVDKTARHGDCLPGGTCDFLVEVRNLGPADYHGPVVLDDFATLLGPGGAPLPGGAIQAITPGWACAVEGAGARCSHAGSLDIVAGGGPIHFEVRVHVPDTIATNLRNCANLAWPEMAAVEDTSAANDRDCDTRPITQPEVVVEPVNPDLQITKQAMQANCEPGGQCDFTVRVTNNGPGWYRGPIVVSDELPPYDAVTGEGGWTCDHTLETLVCTHPDVAVAEGAFVELSVHGRLQPAGLAQTVENCATIDWARMPPLLGDSNAGNNRACVEVPVTLFISNIAITTQALGACRLGGLCNIGMTIQNTSALPFHAQLGIDGQLDPALAISQVQAMGAGWVCSVNGSGVYQCRHNPLDLAAGARQSFRLAVPIPASLTARSLRHAVKLVWVEGKPDANAKDDQASVVIPLQDAVTPPVCSGGRHWNGSACVCSSGQVWNGQQCRTTTAPHVACTGGSVQNGACVCPSGWTRTQTATNAYRCERPQVQLRCINGKIDDGQCLCPSNWRRVRIGTNTYRCERPQAQLRCINGKVHDGQCLCPSNWRQVRIGTNAYRCERPQAQLRCINGKVHDGQCLCPSNWRRVRIGTNAYRCERPQAQLRCINGKVHDGQCLCPSNWRQVRIGTNAYRCERPQATLQCIGGKVSNGSCNCPRGMKAMRVKRGVFRCVKQ